MIFFTRVVTIQLCVNKENILSTNDIATEVHMILFFPEAVAPKLRAEKVQMCRFVNTDKQSQLSRNE